MMPLNALARLRDLIELRDRVERDIDAQLRRIAAAPPRPPDDARPITNPVRLWALENGHPVGRRGRIPESVMRAYRVAHPEEDQP